MNEFDVSSINSGEERERSRSSPAVYYPPLVSASDARVIELEFENARLNRLVAELLIKNQQLRKSD
jgi:hypothetical protein